MCFWKSTLVRLCTGRNWIEHTETYSGTPTGHCRFRWWGAIYCRLYSLLFFPLYPWSRWARSIINFCCYHWWGIILLGMPWRLISVGNVIQMWGFIVAGRPIYPYWNFHLLIGGITYSLDWSTACSSLFLWWGNRVATISLKRHGHVSCGSLCRFLITIIPIPNVYFGIFI